MAKVYQGERTFLSPVLRDRSSAASIASPASTPTRSRTGSATRPPCCSFNFIGFVVVYLLQRLQGVLPLNPQGFAAVEPGLVVQHGGELRDQHELAGLRRRDRR